MNVYTYFDFKKNEIRNVSIQNLSEAPVSPVKGQIYFNNVQNRLYYYSGVEWVAADGMGQDYSPDAILAAVNESTGTIDLARLPASVAQAITDSHIHSNKAVLDATTASYTTGEQTKLSGMEAGAQVNVDTNLGYTTGEANGVVTSSTGSNATIPAATTSLAGLMTNLDKTKLDTVATNANNYVHPANHPPSIITQDANNRFVTDTEKSTWNAKQNALGYTAENAANKGVVNGYAGLDANAKVPLAQLPDTAKQFTYVVADSTARLALTNLISGDKAFETTTKDTYIWDGTAWQVLSDADWENVSLDWANIEGKPTSTPANIDAAVTASHARQHSITSADDHASMTANRIIGRISTAGAPQELTAANVRTIINVADGANNYTHPSDGGGSVSALTGANVISAVTVNAQGHVTATATRAIAATDIGATRKVAANLGNASATDFIIEHNLNSRDLVVTIRESASPYSQVITEVEFTTVNTLTVRFAQAPASSEFRISIVG